MWLIGRLAMPLKGLEYAYRRPQGFLTVYSLCVNLINLIYPLEDVI